MSERLARVSEELREILALEIQRLKDPRLGFVTVTGVRVTPDLRRARVFYTVLGEERDHKATRAALRSARSHLRAIVGHEIRIKVTPELEFEEDDAAEQGKHIEALIAKIHQGELHDDEEDEHDGPTR
jgi:ribosome-binding factor A